jgi:glycosyltransferase involved in cell wall biosynthesis
VKVLAYPADQGGCGFYRLIHACRHLIAQGADLDYVVEDDPAERQLQALWFDGPNGRHVVDAITPDADIVVLQRPLRSHLPGAIRSLQAKGVRVVVEIDDDFEHISPRNISWTSVQPHLSPGRNRAHLREACELADLVTVSTPALADVYGRHGRVVVIPNCVPRDYLLLRQDPHDDLYVGWSGSTETHPDDLQQCRTGIARAIAATGAKMAVVGTGKDVRKNLGLAETPLASGWRTLADYPEALAQFDVGIVPLELSPFNEAKSWLKGLEMAAVGVPFVASPTQQYRALTAEGAGLLAETPRQWEGIVKALLRDDDRRAELAAAGRAVAERWTIEGNIERWTDAWAQALRGPGQHALRTLAA